MQSRFARLRALVSLALSLVLSLALLPDVAHAERRTPFNGQEATRRGAKWARMRVPYSQTRRQAGYRRDCSGLVSMAWNLPENLVTWRIPLVARRISQDELREGDVILDSTSASKHVIIFERWTDRRHIKYIGIEQTGQDGVERAVRRVIPYPYRVNQSRYKPWRYEGMDRYWKVIPKGQRQPVRGYKGPELTPEQMAARARAEAERIAAAQAITAEESRKAQEQARELVEKAQKKGRGLSQPPVIDAVESVAQGTIGGLVATLAAAIIEPAEARAPQLSGVLPTRGPEASSSASRSVAALGVEIGAE